MKQFLLFLSVFFLGILNGFGQEVNFNVTPKRGCIPLKVHVDASTNCKKELNWQYQFKENGELVEDSTFTYDSAGKYTIKVFLSCGGSGASKQKENIVEALAKPKPAINILKCDSRNILVKAEDTVYEEYIMKWGYNKSKDTLKAEDSLTFQYPDTKEREITMQGRYVPGACGDSITTKITPIDKIQLPGVNIIRTGKIDPDNGQIELNISGLKKKNHYNLLYKKEKAASFDTLSKIKNIEDTLNISKNDLNTLDNHYCFKLEGFDPCGKGFDLPQFCNVNLKAAAKENYNQLDIELVKFSQFDSVYIYKDNRKIDQIQAKTNNITYLDSNILCGRKYCYHIEAQHKSPDLKKAISNKQCIETIAKLTPFHPDSMLAGVKNNNVFLSWNAYQARGLRKVGIYENNHSDKGYKLLEKVYDSTYSISGKDFTRKPPCYKIKVTDSCSKVSDLSEKICPVFLRMQEVSPGTFELSWSKFNGGNEFTLKQYVLQRLDEKGKVINETSFMKGTLNSQQDLGENTLFISYRIKAVLNDGYFVYSNVVKLKKTLNLGIPNAFTPNGDGLNDTFKPKGRFAETYYIEIYDQWGNIVFTSSQLDRGWDGVINGKKAKSGTYTYYIKATGPFGKKIEKTGTVTLIR